MSTSILHPWVTRLGLRHQGVLLTGIRGCDGVPKHDLSKPVMRAIRFMVIVNYDFRETTNPLGFTHWDPIAFKEGVEILAKNLDEYPCHFVFHMLHALEVIGFCFPRCDAFEGEAGYEDVARSARSYDIKVLFAWAYRRLVSKFHVNPETAEQLEARLHEDRVANGTVAG